MKFPKPPRFNTLSGRTSSQSDLNILSSFIIYTDSKRACALCGEIKNNHWQHQPSSAKDDCVSLSRRASCSAIFQIRGCDHVFHEACLLNFLEEGISVDVQSSGHVEKLPAEMRSMVPAARCSICGTVQGLVGKAGLSASGLAEWATLILIRRFEAWEAQERKDAEELGGGVGASK